MSESCVWIRCEREVRGVTPCFPLLSQTFDTQIYFTHIHTLVRVLTRTHAEAHTHARMYARSHARTPCFPLLSQTIDTQICAYTCVCVCVSVRTRYNCLPVAGSSDFFGLNYYTTRYAVAGTSEDDPTYKGDCNFEEQTDPQWTRSVVGVGEGWRERERERGGAYKLRQIDKETDWQIDRNIQKHKAIHQLIHYM